MVVWKAGGSAAHRATHDVRTLGLHVVFGVLLLKLSKFKSCRLVIRVQWSYLDMTGDVSIAVKSCLETNG